MLQHWVQAPEHATVFTFTVVHHAIHPAVTGHLPCVVAVVDFPQLAQVRVVVDVVDVADVADVADVDLAQIRVGLSVRLWRDRLADAGAAASSICLPRFRPASGWTA